MDASNAANRIDRLPISRFDKITLVALSFAYFFEFADINSFAVTAARLISLWGVTVNQIAYVTSLSFVGMFLGSVVAGWRPELDLLRGAHHGRRATGFVPGGAGHRPLRAQVVPRGRRCGHRGLRPALRADLRRGPDRGVRLPGEPGRARIHRLAYAYSPELFDTRARSMGAGVSYGLGRLSHAAGPLIIAGLYNGSGYQRRVRVHRRDLAGRRARAGRFRAAYPAGTTGPGRRPASGSAVTPPGTRRRPTSYPEREGVAMSAPTSGVAAAPRSTGEPA